MLISEALSIFLAEKQIQGAEKRTLDNYIRVIGYFIAFAGDLDIEDVMPDHIKAYTAYLLQKQSSRHFAKHEQPTVSRSTVRTYLTHVRSFFNYLYAEEHMQTKIFERIKLPKEKRQEVEILLPDEIPKLWAYFGKGEQGQRYRAFICLLLDTGIRRSEAINATIQDVNIDRAEMLLRDTKSGHQRIVPLGHLTRLELMKYIMKYRYASTGDRDSLFTMNGGVPITTDAIKSLFMRLSKYMGRRVYPHLLRHTFATLYLAQYGDVYSLKQILGHSSINMTNKYLQMANRIRVSDRSLMDDISKTRKINGLKNRHF